MPLVRTAFIKFCSALFGKIIIEAAVRQIDHIKSPEAENFKDALAALARNQFSAEEQKIFSQIEALRNELTHSAEKITIRDFGAGSGAPSAPPKEAAEGK